MDEQLIRQQTAVLLDAYRELTGSKEIPGIEDFLKLRATAFELRRRNDYFALGRFRFSFYRKLTRRGSRSYPEEI